MFEFLWIISLIICCWILRNPIIVIISILFWVCILILILINSSIAFIVLLSIDLFKNFKQRYIN